MSALSSCAGLSSSFIARTTRRRAADSFLVAAMLVLKSDPLRHPSFRKRTKTPLSRTSRELRFHGSCLVSGTDCGAHGSNLRDRARDMNGRSCEMNSPQRPFMSGSSRRRFRFSLHFATCSPAFPRAVMPCSHLRFVSLRILNDCKASSPANRP